MPRTTHAKMPYKILLPVEIVKEIDELVVKEGYAGRSDFILTTLRKEIAARKWIEAITMQYKLEEKKEGKLTDGEDEEN